MPRFPVLQQPLLIIELEPGQVAAQGATWAEIGPVIDFRWSLDGSIPDRPGTLGPYGLHDQVHRAREAAIDHAMREGVSELWIEFDARRCD